MLKRTHAVRERGRLSPHMVARRCETAAPAARRHQCSEKEYASLVPNKAMNEAKNAEKYPNNDETNKMRIEGKSFGEYRDEDEANQETIKITENTVEMIQWTLQEQIQVCLVEDTITSLSRA